MGNDDNKKSNLSPIKLEDRKRVCNLQSDGNEIFLYSTNN